MDKSVKTLIHVTQEPLGNDDPTLEKLPQNEQPTMTLNGRPLDQFCRLCLRQCSDLVPLQSHIQDMSLPEIFRAITGLKLILEDTYPLLTCRTCMGMLDYAFDIRQNFIESYQILKTFWLSKTQPLISNLREYQGGVRATSETLAEKMLRVYRNVSSRTETDDLHSAAPRVNSNVGILQPQEKPVELLVQIKHEPELILEPEELLYPADTIEERITNDNEGSADRFEKMRNIPSWNKLDPNKCYICNKVFKTTEDVQVHISKHVNMIPYQCSACTHETVRESKIISLNRLHSHFRMHASAIKCPECPHRTCSRWAMLTHLRTNHEQFDKMEYICEQCGKKFPNKRSLHNHELAHKALDEGQYPCSYCDKKLSSNVTLIRHERIHTGEKPFQCHACAESFRVSGLLSEHISKNHTKSEQVSEVPILTCKFEGCNFSTTKRRQYCNHKAKHELELQCSDCPQRFPNGKELQRHLYVHTGVKDFPCQQCDKSFRNKRSFEKHVAGHNNERRYACEMCGMTFVRKRILKHHLLKHSAQLSFECQHCGMKFKNRESHAKHEKSHMESAVQLIDLDTGLAGGTSAMKTETIDGDNMLQEYQNIQLEISPEAVPKLIPCVIIPEPQEDKIELPVQIKREPEFILQPEHLPGSPITVAEAATNNTEPTAEEFRKMRKMALPNKPDPYKCYICNKVLETIKGVQIHLPEHGDMIPYRCSSCTMETGQELKITSLNVLHRHFRMHVSSIKCPMCPHRTCTRRSMQRHIRTYHEQSDQVECICEQCGKKFLNKQSLYNHELAHKARDEGRFPCSYCDMKLSSKLTQIRHERIHMGEKPYQCYACAKVFRLSWLLSVHISNVHKKPEQVNDDIVLTCKYGGCDFSTTNKCKYDYHKAKHELRFQCSQCSRRFPKQQALRKHQHVHTNT